MTLMIYSDCKDNMGVQMARTKIIINCTFNVPVEKTPTCIWIWESFAIKYHGLWVGTILKFQYKYSVYVKMDERKKLRR